MPLIWTWKGSVFHMKKRILLLIPCILLALGLLTACGDNGSQSSGSIENQLINAEWKGNADTSSGLINIGLPIFDLSDIITIKFDSDSNGNKTGFISVLNQKVDFTWNIKDKDHIVLTFENSILPLSLDFRLNGDSLSLTGTGINIKLTRT